VSSVVKFPPKEIPLKEIAEKVISCDLEVHSTLFGLLINFNLEILREGKNG